MANKVLPHRLTRRRLITGAAGAGVEGAGEAARVPVASVTGLKFRIASSTLWRCPASIGSTVSVIVLSAI